METAPLDGAGSSFNGKGNNARKSHSLLEAHHLLEFTASTRLPLGENTIGSAKSPGISEPNHTASGLTAAEEQTVKFRWRAVAAGAVCAYLLSVALGIGIAKMGLGENLIARPLVTFAALLIGGWMAGWMAGIAGPINGSVVGIVYIVGWAIENAVFEGRLVETYGYTVLPRMNIMGILLGDFLILTGAASGGWIAELWRHWRVAKLDQTI